jgi:hypothetical protein
MQSLKMSNAYLAIDAGGVLFHKESGGISRKPIQGAIEWLSKLKDEGCRLFLISFASRKTAGITVNDIAEYYPNLFDGLFFVKNKLEKVALCRYLGSDVMIDDTWEVHRNIRDGLYLDKPKIIHSIPTVFRILFT